MRKKLLYSLLTLALVWALTPAMHADADDWIQLGTAHVDGQQDHDTISVGEHAGKFRWVQLRVTNAPIEFDHVVVHYGDGQPETLKIRSVIPAGGHTRDIKLDGTRFIQSLEVWYGKAKANSGKPELSLWGKK